MHSAQDKLCHFCRDHRHAICKQVKLDGTLCGCDCDRATAARQNGNPRQELAGRKFAIAAREIQHCAHAEEKHHDLRPEWMHTRDRLREMTAEEFKQLSEWDSYMVGLQQSIDTTPSLTPTTLHEALQAVPDAA